ncbi:uncharacterized protein EI97DRAFT_291523 [Westerdykella ornata]|uniref:Uncharacterized protein n=1 Tax=Westerdykella ornata TaxID=318751 RepID=A0A6A6JR38_WESOR|nr:uncharacterized protein EI97DRAFT_291523 [Westerdykella ornata]KAF2277429.1 hypothetical protein EI97DRAFT_291523 [Westerdykella ornata]
MQYKEVANRLQGDVQSDVHSRSTSQSKTAPVGIVRHVVDTQATQALAKPAHKLQLQRPELLCAMHWYDSTDGYPDPASPAAVDIRTWCLAGLETTDSVFLTTAAREQAREAKLLVANLRCVAAAGFLAPDAFLSQDRHLRPGDTPCSSDG